MWGGTIEEGEAPDPDRIIEIEYNSPELHWHPK